MLRAEAEVRLREVRLESDCCKARLATLQEDFRKMEEMVQNMIQFKTRIEQLKHEKSTLTITYESKMRKYQTYIASLEKENFLLLNELKSIEVTSPESSSLLEERDQSVSQLLLERLRLLEQENSSLVLENEQQKMQYERCLDDVANQVVQALLAQKSLREECAKLQCRVQDLEEQNRALTLLFRQRFCTQTGKENDLCWSTPGETRSDSGDTVNRLQAFEQSSHHVKCNVKKHASQSEASTESLSSLCSDYSLQSCGSGAHHISGCSKLSSPPQWLREQQQQLARPICPASSLLRERALQSSSSSHLGLWASLLQRHDCLTTSGAGPKDDSHLLTYQKLACLNRTPRRPEDWLNLDISHDWKSHRAKRRSLPLSDQAQSDIADLDSMETPSDESISFDNLPVLNSSSKIFGGSLSNGAVSSASKYTPDSGASVFCQLQRSGNLSHSLLFGSPPRPNTLNIVPHIMGDPAHNFSFQALERKTHLVNSSGNVYEEIDLPPFPVSVESDPGLLFNSQYSGESPNCDKDSLSNLTNTVIRRQEVSFALDSLKKSLGDRSSFLHLPSPSLPPPANLSPIQHPPGPSQSPLSNGEHGKDEGYSTMSSDVQAEGNASGVGSGYTVSSPPPVLPETVAQPHLITMLSSFSSEALMASSTDSGLSLQLRSVQARKQILQEEEGFERELGNSLIRNHKDVGVVEPSEEQTESGQLDSGLGDSPSIHKITSFRDQSDAVSSLLEDKLLEDLKCQRTSVDYDKILTLLTPRGFRASDNSSRPPSIVQSIGAEVKVETAEKSTFTEPDDTYIDRSSQGSLLSNNDYSKETCTKFSETISCASTCSMDCLGAIEDRLAGMSTTQRNNKSVNGWQDLLDIYCISCKYCRLRNRQPHKLKFSSRLEALGNLLRAFSDSHLVIRQQGESSNMLGARADSLGNRCPPLRLNLLPLERHCSAYDLSPQSESRLLPVDPQVNVPNQVQEKTPFCLQDLQVQRLLSLEAGGEGSLSASTVHSSTSSSGGELVASAEEEPEEEASAIYFGQEMTSDSDNDLLESNNFVEKWLQQGTTSIPDRLQNGYAYDEEEIGNWSLQLSSEDLSQSSTLAPAQWNGEWPPPPPGVSSNTENSPSATLAPQPIPQESSRLACIQENILEGDFQEDFWNVPLSWENKNPEAVPETEKSEDTVTETKMEANVEEKDKIVLSEETSEPCVEPEKPVVGAETEEDLQFEVAEFNRDFYRLCSMDSSRSLDASVRSLTGGSVCKCPDPKHHRHVHSVDAQENAQLEVEPVSLAAKQTRSKRSHSQESGKENKSIEKTTVDPSERKNTASRNRDRIQGPSIKTSAERKPSDKTRIPVITKSASSHSQQQKKRSSIPKRERESEDKLRKHDKASIPKLRSLDSARGISSPLTSPLRLGNNVLKVPVSRTTSNPESTKHSSSARSHSREKKLLSRVQSSKEAQKTPLEQDKDVPGAGKKLSTGKKHTEALKLESRENVLARRKGPDGNKFRCKRSKEGCGTSWVHFEADVDLSDPKARANLLDSMMASSSSGSSSEGEDADLVAGEGPTLQVDEPQVQQHQHLHALHRIRRHKKRVADPDAVLSFLPRLRASIIDRHDFYYRFGEKEREAVACFDFLDDLSTSPSDVDAADNANSAKVMSNNNTIAEEDASTNRLSLDETKLFSCQSSPHNSFSSATLNSQECDHISFSDSCAESYSSSTHSLNRLV